eukprot:gene491-8005_t
MTVSEEEINELLSSNSKQEIFPFIFTKETLVGFIKEITSPKGIPTKKKSVLSQIFSKNSRQNIYFTCDEAITWFKEKSKYIPDFSKERELCSTMGQLLKLIGVFKDMNSKENNFRDSKNLQFKFTKKVKEENYEKIIKRYQDLLRVITFSNSQEKMIKFLSDLDSSIDVSERQSNGKCYKDSFIGSQLVTWISTTYLKIERRAALRLSDQFIHAGLIEEAEKSSNIQFKDDFVVYEKVHPFEIGKLKQHTQSIPTIIQLLLYRSYDSSLNNISLYVNLSATKSGNKLLGKPAQSFGNIDISPRTESDTEDEHNHEQMKKHSSLELPRDLLVVIPIRRCHSLPVPLYDLNQLKESNNLSSANSSQNLSSLKSSSKFDVSSGSTGNMKSPTSKEAQVKRTSQRKINSNLQSVSVNTIKTNTGKVFVDKKKDKSVKSIIQAAKTKPEDVTYVEGPIHFLLNRSWKKFYIIVKFGVIIMKHKQKDTSVYQMINMTNKTICQQVSVSNRKYCLSFFVGGNPYFFDCLNRNDCDIWFHQIVKSIEDLQRSQRSALQDVKYAGVASDINGIVTEFNEKAELLFGFKKENVIGKNLKILLPPGLNFLHERFIGTYKKTGETRATRKEMNAIILNDDESPVPVTVKHFRLPPMAFQKSAFYVEIKQMAIETEFVSFKTKEKVNLKDLFGLKGETSEFISSIYKSMNENFKLIEEKIESFKLNEKVLKEQVEYFKIATEVKKREIDIMESEINLFSENSKLDKVMDLLDSEDADFRSFCKSLNCESAWLFWNESQKFRKQKSNQKEVIIKEATRIFDSFLNENSEFGIVVDSEASQYIKEKIQTGEKNVFKSVQKDVLFLLEEKVYFQYMDLTEIDEVEFNKIDVDDEEDEEEEDEIFTK